MTGKHHPSPKLYQFGQAPKARADGFAVFVTTVRGNEGDVSRLYGGKDVALVQGAALYGTTDQHEYGVFAR